MAKLGECDEAVIRLRDIEEKSLQEAAAVMNRSESATKTAHFRAKKRLAAIMVGEGPPAQLRCQAG